jgi:hypothetical protein
MSKKTITLEDVRKRIRDRIKERKRYDWLGFVENKDLTPEVENLFYLGSGWWDWVKGNSKLWALEKEVENEQK